MELTPEIRKARVDLCKEAIAQIEAHKVVVETGNYLLIPLAGAGIKPGDDIAVAAKKAKAPCTVCLKGALFMAAVGMGSLASASVGLALTYFEPKTVEEDDELAIDACDIFRTYEDADSEGRGPFDRETADRMEGVFEQWRIYSGLYPGTTDEDRAVAILRHCIDHAGEFDPLGATAPEAIHAD